MRPCEELSTHGVVISRELLFPSVSIMTETVLTGKFSEVGRLELDALADDNTLAYDVIMIRTQISLTEEEYQAAKLEAQRLGISLSELLRRSLRSIIPTDSSKPWMRYAGLVESGDPDSSKSIDGLIYGQK